MTTQRKIQLIILSVIPFLLIFGTYLLVTLDGPAHEETVVLPEVAEEVVLPFKETAVIGSSVEGRPIEATTYGNGDTQLLFVGGMHGGYEWNSSLLAYQFMQYVEENPDFIPEDVTVSVIPTLNPDGLYKATGLEGVFTLADVPDPSTRVAEGRFNANDVDLNRNFACKWAPESSWKGNVVSAGTAAFSEPEAAALRDYVATILPKSVVFWHSKASNVYASECEDGVLPETLEVMNTYATAANYGAVASFDAYPITGDAEGWLASIGIPAVTVELETADSSEWTRNIAGVTALLELYSLAK